MMIALTVSSTLLIVIFSAALLVWACRLHRLMNPTPLGVAFLALLATHYLPSIAYLFDPLKPQAEAFHWACTIALAMLALGGLLANAISQFNPQVIKPYYRMVSSLNVPPGDAKLVHMLGAACAVIFAAYVYEVPIWPMRRLLEDGLSASLNTAWMRDQTTGADMPSQWWYLYGVTKLYLMPLLFSALMLCWPTLKLGGKIWATGLLLMVLVYNSWSGQKVPIAMVFLIAAIAFIPKACNRPTRGSRKRLVQFRVATAFAILLIAATISYPILVFKLQAYGQSRAFSEVLVDGVLKRIFATPAMLSYQQFELFPRHEFTSFRDIRKLADLTGFDYINLSELTSSLGGADRLYNAPPAAVGNFYAQSGWPMIILGMLVAGFMFQLLFVWTIRRAPASGLVPAVLALLCFGGFRISMTSFHSVLLTESLLPTILVIFAWRTFRGLPHVWQSSQPRQAFGTVSVTTVQRIGSADRASDA